MRIQNTTPISNNVFIFFFEKGIKVIDVSSELEKDKKHLLVDCTASCLASNEKYFSTLEEKQPWVIFDLREIRTMYGLRIYLRVDGGERNLKARQSTFYIFLNIGVYNLVTFLPDTLQNEYIQIIEISKLYLGFSNMSIYISRADSIQISDIETLKNLTELKDDMDAKEYADKLKKFTNKYPLCGSYNKVPTLEHVLIDVTCQFPFKVRYVLFMKNSVHRPSHLTFNDVQFKLKG